jgi:two-component system cell cycle sensor histidine kinase/response regulator CckA
VGTGWLGGVGLDRLQGAEAWLAEGFAADGALAIRDLQVRPPAGVLEEEGIRAILLVPLRTRGRTVGLLCLADPEPRDFSSEVQVSALAVAALTAAALERRREIDAVRSELAEQAAEVGRGEADKARVLAAFAAGLTRELNSVFATLLGKSQLLLTRAQSDPLHEDLTSIEEAAWRGADMVQRLLGLAEADRPGAVPCDLAAIAQEALGFARARVPSAPGATGYIEMVADLGATLPVQGSATALRDAVLNLALNAMEAMPAGGTVIVRTRRTEDGAELEVADSGEGIPPEVRPRIFDPFFTTRPGHLGLGLVVAQAAVLRAGGRLDLRHGRAGGTVITVWLPTFRAPDAAAVSGPAPGEAAPAVVADAPARAERTASILVVEEEEGIRTAVLDALMAVGHRVEAVSDGSAALERLARGGIDVVVTDLALRDRSGLHLAAAVKERSPHAAVVLLTGWGRRLREERVRGSGVDVMLVKPVQPDRVRSAVAEALRLRSV